MTGTTLIIAAVVGVFYMFFVMAALRVTDKKTKETRKNLITGRGLTNYDVTAGSNDKKKDTKGKGKVNIAKKLKNATDASEADNLSPSSVRYMLIQAGLETPVYKFWVYSVISGVIFYAASLFFNTTQLVSILLTITGFLGFPRFILKRKVNRRQKQFLEEMPDCLEAMVRLLKSGMPISEAIAMTSREFTGPIGEEVTKVYEAQRIGDTLPDAVQGMAFRVPLPEVKMFSTAITIQVQTGSSLSDVLLGLSNVIRQRFRLKRKVAALSAEARISAGIIGALPLTVVAGMMAINPSYIELLWTTDQGKTLLYGCLFWMGIGVVIMRQMINFKI